MKYFVLVLYLLNVFVFVWGVRAIFRRPASMPRMLRVLRCAAVAAALVQGVSIATYRGMGVSQAVSAVIALMVALGLFAASARTARGRFFAAFSNVRPGEVVTEGPFRWIRHPFYTSYIMTYVAAFVAVPRWWMGLTVAVMAAIYFRAARLEEIAFADAGFYQEYARYRSSTGMFFPKALRHDGSR